MTTNLHVPPQEGHDLPLPDIDYAAAEGITHGPEESRHD